MSREEDYKMLFNDPELNETQQIKNLLDFCCDILDSQIVVPKADTATKAKVAEYAIALSRRPPRH
jgi:hypothetical protein